MKSFYRGQNGNGFIIKYIFDDTIENNEITQTAYSKMIYYFNQKSNFSDVKYGQYVLLKPFNKNDSTYGAIYRRGYEGPEFVGTIAGPSGYLPNIDSILTEPYNTIDLKVINNISQITEYQKTELSESEDESNLILTFDIPKDQFNFYIQYQPADYSYNSSTGKTTVYFKNDSTTLNGVTKNLPISNNVDSNNTQFNHIFYLIIPYSDNGTNITELLLTNDTSTITNSAIQTQMQQSGPCLLAKTQSFEGFTPQNESAYTLFTNLTTAASVNDTSSDTNIDYYRYTENTITLEIPDNYFTQCQLIKTNNDLSTKASFKIAFDKPLNSAYTPTILSGTFNISINSLNYTTDNVIPLTTISTFYTSTIELTNETIMGSSIINNINITNDKSLQITLILPNNIASVLNTTGTIKITNFEITLTK